MGSVTIDFVVREGGGQSWVMVLVEQGPWEDDAVEDKLRELQNRLYGCIDAALDGQLAERFPESKGKPILIRVDGYNLPNQEVRAFFARFSGAVLELPDYAAALVSCLFVSGISFQLVLEPCTQ